MQTTEHVAGTHGFIFDPQESADLLPTWVHASAPVWIRQYTADPSHRDYDVFYVYKSTKAPKPGQRPWAVDNRVQHDKDMPPRSLEAALAIGERAAGGAA